MSDPPSTSFPAPDSSDRSGGEVINDLQLLGEQLRQARQQQGLGVEELAVRLHIGANQLEALENGDRSGLPEGVFVIAQARRVAEVLGVDVQQPIDRLRQSRLMRPQAPATPSPPTAPRSVAPKLQVRRSRSLPRWIPAAALMALALLGVAFGLTRWRRPQTGDLPRRPPSPAVPSTPASGTSPAPASGTAAPRANAPAPSTPSLLLRSTEASWMEVRDAQGTTLFEGSLDGEKRFRLDGPLEVRAGRPHAVTVQVGQAPARALGTVDDLDWHRFTPPPPAASPP